MKSGEARETERQRDNTGAHITFSLERMRDSRDGEKFPIAVENRL